MIYEFLCDYCGVITEKLTSDTELKEIECPACKQKARKIMSPFIFNFYDMPKRREEAKKPDFYYTT